MEVRNLEVEDYHDLVNAILDGPSLEAIVSFRVEWTGSQNRQRFHNVQQQYDGDMIINSARCVWSGETSEARYVSDPGSSVTIYAQVGKMRNGAFFS
jgi:hypothetical protein